jgi:hypothetical protein
LDPQAIAILDPVLALGGIKRAKMKGIAFVPMKKIEER